MEGKVINAANLSFILRDWSQSSGMRLDIVEEHTFGMFIKKQAVYVVLGYIAREQRNGYGLTQRVSGARARSRRESII